jgi:tRNA threonylcarbamoyladenosine biosynthesis protein TsaE
LPAWACACATPLSGSSDSPQITDGAAATEAVGAALAATLRPGDVVLLEGEMGAGKTTFVRGAVRALGFEGPVTSPTFTIGRRYEGGRLPIAHLDLHRLSGLADEDPALLDDYLTPDAIAFVEWPAIAEPQLERVAARVKLEHAGGDTRRITVVSSSSDR